MEQIFTNTFAASLLCGVIFLIAAGITYSFPPRKINYLYGYRTNASMKSQDRWDFAQGYSTRQMIKAAIALIVVSFLGYFMDDSIIKFVIDLAMIIAVVVYIIFSTETAIKRQFPEIPKV